MQDIFREIWQNSPSFAKQIDQLALSAGTAATWTVPDDVDTVLIGVTAGDLYASDSNTAVVPAATITNGSGSEKILDGSVRRVDQGNVISFINATACVVTFSLFKGQ